MGAQGNIKRKPIVNKKKTSGRNKVLSRLNKFGKFLLAYTGVLVGIVLILLVLLYGLLKDYESSMPNNTMDTVVKQFTAENIEKLLNENAVSVNEFESSATVADYFKSVMSDSGVTYKRKNGEFTNTTPVYVVMSGKTIIAKVTLAEKGQNAHKFTEWKVGTISFDGYIDAKNDITITAPSAAVVKINGVTVGESYIKQKDVTFDPVKNVGTFVTTPTNTVYKVSGLMAAPQITATLNGTELPVNVDKKICKIGYPTDAALLEAQKANINAINEAYGKYIINKGSLSNLTKYLVGNAKSHVSDIPAVWAFLYGMTYTYEFKNQNITDMVKYSDNCFSCTSNYDLYVQWSNGNKTYNTSMIYTFVKTNGNWYLADFLIN